MWKEVRSDDCNQKFRYCIGGSVVLVHAMCRFFYFVSGKQMAVLSCTIVVRVSSSAHACACMTCMLCY